jgi:UDP-hydrolysing UDP-N-acetyl-D-glucosamine 2-epimerase
MRRVCVVIGSRANYSSIKAGMRAVKNHPDLELQLIVGASAVLDRYGSVVDVIERDGFIPDARINIIVEGETPATMAKSTGLGLLELPTLFELFEPDVVVIVGDRFETMAPAVAAAYMNIPLAHTMGGEVSGTIDESIRHAVTKLAHLHFPANQAAADRIVRMGEEPDTVHVIGCPRLDLVDEVVSAGNFVNDGWLEREGVGGEIDLAKPFLLVSQHPVTTEFGAGESQIDETLCAVRALDIQAIILWPNVDAGSEDIARGMRKFREHYDPQGVRFYKNFPVEVFVGLMKRAACLVGNSSAFIREGAFLGAPAVNIGSRQMGRDRGRNVIDVPYNHEAITAAVRQQVEHGCYPSDHLYGDGQAGPRLADVLATAPIRLQKRITY